MFNTENLKKINSMSDDTLKEKINAAANAAGAGKINLSSGDLEKLRAAVMNLSKEDVRKITENVDPKTIEAIKKSMNIS